MKKVSIWLIVGIILRVAFMATTAHPDIRGHNLGGYLIAQKGEVFGLYDYISRLPRDNILVQIYHDDLFIYPPLAYLFQGLSLKLFSPFIHWPLFEQMIVDFDAARTLPGFSTLMVWLKMPYLLADIGVLYLLFKLVDKKHHVITEALWAFNIPVLYSAYMLGQLDVFMVLFILGSVLLATQKKHTLAAVAMGLAAGFKPFPFFLLPFLPGNRIKNVLIGLGTYFVIILPYLGSTGFRQYALLAPQADKIWYAKILVSGSQYLPLFVVGLVVLFWLSTRSARPAWEWPLYVLLLFYSVVHFHPQWFAWVSPLLIIYLATHKKRWPLVGTLLLAYVGIVLSFEPSLNFGLFGLNYNLFQSIAKYYPPDQLVSGLRGVLAGTSLGIGLLGIID